VIPLETEFYSRGFCHKLVRRARFVALYERWRRANPEKVIHYEVVVIRLQKAHTHNEIEYPEREVYPTSEQWGTYGWTCPNEDQARSRFEMLLAVGRDAPGRWFSVANESLVNPIKGTPPRAGARDSK